MSGTISAGAVNVTNGSANVAGSGTAWVGVLRAGWLMKLPDGQHYTIASVDSATQVTLADEYQGSTVSGADYRAVPTGAVALDLAGKVSELVDDYASVKNNAGEGKFANGTNAQPSVRGVSDQDTGINFNGNANEMDFVTGGTRRGGFKSDGLELNTPMIGTVVQQSATDITAGRLMRADYGYSPGNLIGTVSQSGGTPTGAIFEWDINANGYYERHTSGLQICTVRNLHDDAVASGAAVSGTWITPAPFANNNFVVIPTARRTAGTSDAETVAEFLRTSAVALTTSSAAWAIHATGTYPSPARLDLMAIGRCF